MWTVQGNCIVGVGVGVGGQLSGGSEERGLKLAGGAGEGVGANGSLQP